MTTRDPILHVIRVGGYRVLFFLAGSLLIAALVGVEVLRLGFDLPDAVQWWEVFQSAIDGTPSTDRVLAWLCGTVGLLTTSVVYLLLALWWRRRGDVYRRGARLVDARGGRD